MTTPAGILPANARRLTASLLLSISVFAGLCATTAPKATAWAWDPGVSLQGKVGCNYAASNQVSWAWVEATNGERGWASLGAGGMTKPYSFQFRRVPPGGTTVTIRWGCSTAGQYSTTFGLQRPASGTSATRNICHWSPCWL